MRVVIGVAAAATASALIFQRKGDPEPWKCYIGEPTSYTGIEDTSNAGLKCMPWAVAAEHEQLSATFGDLTGGAPQEKLDGNFCRAFTPGDVKPWCFVLGFASPAEAKQDCDVPQCPTDGPWSKDYHQEAADAEVPCTDTDGVPQKECDCSCAGAGGRALLQTNAKTGKQYICHC